MFGRPSRVSGATLRDAMPRWDGLRVRASASGEARQTVAKASARERVGITLLVADPLWLASSAMMGGQGMAETPAAIKGPASKRTIVDAIVLAFSKSDVRDVVGTDALRMVLEGRYVDMIKTAGVLTLQPVY